MKNPIYNILFIDIETVPVVEHYDNLHPTLKKYWDKKERYLYANEVEDGAHFQQAGLLAEFSKVICVSIGIIYHHEGQDQMRIKSFYGIDEAQILKDLATLLETKFKSTDYYICAHNGKHFDFPFLSRRMIINGISIPNILLIHGRKPWELSYIDTMDLWRFGDYKHTISLELMAHLLGVNSSLKAEMSGEKVYHTYYKEQNLEKIKTYCELDLVAMMNCYRRMVGLELITNF